MTPLRMACVQFEPSPLDVAWNLDRVEHFAARAAEAKAHFVCLPECCITGYMPLATLPRDELLDVAQPVPDGPSVRRLVQIAARHGLAVAAGLVERDEDGNMYNTYVVATPQGRTHAHRKHHPFVHPSLTAGREHTVFDCRGWRFGVLICYDNNQPENGRVLALRGVQVLLAPHQTGGFPVRYAGMGTIDRAVWERREADPDALRAEFRGPKGREWLHRWLPSRAYDNGCYLVFANGVSLDGEEVRTGGSMVLDPHGRILVESDALGDDLIVADLSPAPLGHNLGHSHLLTRRPEMYRPLCEPSGERKDTKAGRDAAIADGDR